MHFLDTCHRTQTIRINPLENAGFTYIVKKRYKIQSTAILPSGFVPAARTPGRLK